MKEIKEGPENNKTINIKIKDGLNVKAHKICKKKDIKKYLFVKNLLNNRVVEKLHSPVDIDVSKKRNIRYQTLKDLLALISTHDVINHTTLWSFMTYWRLTEDRFAEEMPLYVIRIDPNNIDKVIDNISFLVLYFIFIEQFDFSITNFIFRDLTQRPILTVKQGEEILPEYTRDLDGSLSFVDITIPQTKIKSSQLEEKLGDIKTTIKDLLNTIVNRSVHETRGSIVFLEWDKIFEKFRYKVGCWEWGLFIEQEEYKKFSANLEAKICSVEESESESASVALFLPTIEKKKRNGKVLLRCYIPSVYYFLLPNLTMWHMLVLRQ
ncbi:MAG: hypothetical protein ACE5EA_05395 [Nitrospirota bacterium]